MQDNAMTFRIAQISDTHLSARAPFFKSNFDLIIADVAVQNPDLIINTGDLSLDGAGGSEDLMYALAAHRDMRHECLLLPGNHDVGDQPSVARGQPATEERLARYRTIIGPDFWVRDIPGWRLFGLNALIMKTGLSGESDQNAMVRNGLSTRGNRQIAVFMHIPLADTGLDDDRMNNNFIVPDARADFLALFGDARPALILSGHVHQYRDVYFAGMRQIWSPATSFIIADPWHPNLGAKTVGYLIHEFMDDGKYCCQFKTVRGLKQYDLAVMPEVYGDVARWKSSKQERT
jgi:3',5'-cyclic-AMP phosphodiesterase